MKKPAFVFTVLTVLFSFSPLLAQTMPDPDWGEHQNVEAAMKYWLSWEKSGPDTNIAEARAQGFKEFTSMRRPQGFLVQSSPAWTQVGGSLGGAVSGRPTAMAFSKQHNGVCYLGTSGGGLWKSTNFGSSWVFLAGTFTTNAIGGIAVDYTNDNIIYAGTGDLYTNNDQEASMGDGLFKSVDGGLNWTHVATTGAVGGAVNQVILDPVTPSTVYATANDGVHRSLDGGITWKKILGIGGATTHMVIDPNNPNRLYVGGAGVIKRSVDAGATWSGDVAANIGGKSTITMGISAANSSIVYASVGSGSSGNSIGLARSLDSGTTWSIVTNPGGGYMSNQAFYNNACAVSQSNANNVIVGGLDIYTSTNGGTSFPYYTDWRSAAGSGNYTHADIHVLQYGGGFLWALTDGGVFLSGDNGKTWQSRNGTLPTLLFVGGDADANFTFAIGGAQDNGVSKTEIPSGKTFTEKVGGDGGRCFISQTDGLTVYSTYVQASLQKSPDGGETWDIGPRGDNNVIPLGCPLLSEGVPFYMYYDVCESDPATLAVAGGSNVYYTNDGVASLNQIPKSSQIAGGPKTVHVPAADPNTVFASNGSTTFVTRDPSNGGWTKSSVNIGAVSDWATDPTDANVNNVWVSIAGYGSKHFALSTDRGTTWTFPAKNLPNLNMQSIARAPNGDLFLGHTLGVLRSIDNGVTWEALTDGIPLAQVTKLRVRGATTQYLLATTYGHGMYSLDITDLPRTINPLQDVHNTAPSSSFSISSIVPNPVMRGASATLTYTAATSGPLFAKLYDELGRQVKLLTNEYVNSGNGSVQFTLPNESGTYWVVLTEGGKSLTRQIVVQ
ncbi:MAG TPA: T9SS type A sorting domain-containing protein [Candidatus Kapabacteria bacterium]|nr:T9SS type A sorting domain-containing protein [Candidatus Kapabacteria bacterium]